MRIVSLNAWGGACWPAMADWLPGAGIDVLCLQEVIRPVAAGTPGWLRYVDPYRDLAQRGDLFGDVSAALPGHAGWFAPAARGPLTDAGGRVWITDHGLGLWTARGIAVTEARSLFVHGAFRADGWGPEPVPRAMQMVRLFVPGMGRPLVVAHFHGLRDPAGKGDSPARDAQGQAVLAALAEFTQAGDAVVLAGDFNLRPDSRFFVAAAEAGLRDLVTGGGHLDTRTALYPKAERYADYLLVNAAVTVADFAVPAEPVLSDHRALVLDLRAGPAA